MTTHEFDAYLDMQHGEHFEPPYHEQIVILQEFEETREAALKRLGAREALNELKSYLSICAVDGRCTDEFWGLKWAIDSITRRLSDLTIAH